MWIIKGGNNEELLNKFMSNDENDEGLDYSWRSYSRVLINATLVNDSNID